MTVYEKVANGRFKIPDYSSHIGKVVEYESDSHTALKKKIQKAVYASKVVATVVLSMSLSFYITFLR